MTSVPLSAPQAVGPTTASNNRTAIAVTLVVLMALGAAAFWFFAGQGTESTEDAYVDGNVVQITPQTNGTVTAINADSTDMVRAGDVLVSLNPVDASLALQRAQAQLAKSVRQVRGQYSAASQMRASLAQRQSELDRALADMARRAALAKTGAISQEEYIHAQQIVAAAQATLNVAQQQLASSQALVDAPSLSSHPDVMIAAAQVREAFIGAARTELRAPIAGMVTRRSAQVGQRISPGGSLMSVVSLDHVWVSANFKESQLRHLRINQPVTVTADVYGNTVRYRGHVQGLDAGTGSAFSLMPAQNATGNWIKVVQRVPVRIALDPAALAAHPLRLGLSMRVEVDTGMRNGSALTTLAGAAPQGYATKVFDVEQTGADALVKRIIDANAGLPATAPRSAQR